MSLLITWTQESITQLALGPPAAPPGGGGSAGLLDWLTAKLSELQSVFRLLSVVGGMGFVIWQAVASRGAMARIIISGLAAALFVWIVWNITGLQARVENEVNSRSATTTQQLAASPVGALPTHRPVT